MPMRTPAATSDDCSSVGDDELYKFFSETLQEEHAKWIERLQIQLREQHDSVMAAVSSRLGSRQDLSVPVECTAMAPLWNPPECTPIPTMSPMESCDANNAVAKADIADGIVVQEKSQLATSATADTRQPESSVLAEPEPAEKANGEDKTAAEPASPPLERRPTEVINEEIAGEELEDDEDGAELAEGGDVEQTWLGRVVRSSSFESGSAMVIGACTLVMAVDIEYRGLKAGYDLRIQYYNTPSDELWPGMEDAVKVLDVIFNCLFLTELLLRASVLRCASFRSGWMWFDGFLVTTGWLDMLGLLNVGLDPMILRVVRLVRLLRLLKVVKSIKAFETLFLLIRSIQASLGALIWSFLLLVLVQVVMAILLSQLLTAFMENETKDLAVRQRVFMYFGTFTKSLVSMFEVTMGNWGPVTRLLYVDVSEWYGVVFVVFRCCLMFATLKVITAVFIAETVRAAASDDEVVGMKKQRQADAYVFRMRKIFSQLDTSGDGSLTRKEFEPLLNDERIQLVLHTLEIDTHDLDPLFEILDNGDGEIDIDEFLGGMSRMRGPAKSMDLLRVLSHVERLERKFVQFGSHFGIVTEPQINGSAKRTSIGDQRNQVPANTGCTSSRSSALNEEEEQKMMKGLGV
eukprot:gnl/TRDRNA2_/TRDRNA2_171808_c8_seq6.p1 gnl/TRDRNA2_/TRDRNA2_171808_c8~~gnl/TRDRNA2_/TRDRNA2_171808_c8_seq6.p1  ORF type:complete len:632 (-),score=119.62 gnl/TRDRNA2_/TRDRNA2_171808_c8_seq6:98-1993(-)